MLLHRPTSLVVILLNAFKTDVFNASLLKYTVPLFWKEANIRLVPQEQPFTSCNQLRPISLTNITMRLFERLVYRNELSIVCDNHIDLDQFAYRKGHSSTVGREVSRCCGCPLCCSFRVGASHRDNLMHLSPLDRNVQEK